jgi:hypothetical protein
MRMKSADDKTKRLALLEDLQKSTLRRCPELSCRFESVVMNIMLPS